MEGNKPQREEKNNIKQTKTEENEKEAEEIKKKRI